jgi:hypothetical protein
MAAKWLQPTHAITRGLPNSFANALQMSVPPVTIDVDIAARQHDAYNSLIMQLVPNWIGLPADESVPDCLFVEDTAFFVPVEGTSSTTGEPLECVCVITRPGADSRKPEVCGARGVHIRVCFTSICMHWACMRASMHVQGAGGQRNAQACIPFAP